MANEKTPKKIIPGSELHFDIMGARYGFNLLVGSDRKSIQAFARNVWDAALAFRTGKAESLEWVGANSPLHQTLCMRPDPCSECERIEARATPPAATPAAPGDLDADHALALKLMQRLEDAADMWKGWSGTQSTLVELKHAIGGMAQKLALRTAALSHPAPVAAPASVPQAIDQLVSALAESKGWMRDYARVLIEDAIDRRHLEVAAPAPASEAVAQSITIDFKQATELLEMFGDQPCEITLTAYPKDEHHFEEGFTVAAGLYAHYTECPEEGGNCLGVADHDATPAGDSVDAPVQQAEMLTDAARDVLAERQRQISAEGWTPEHDDEHDSGSMAIAAACYAIADRKDVQVQTLNIRMLWRWTGWADLWFKPKDRRHNLVRAGALIIAEVERIDRAALKGEQPEPSGSERGEV